MSSVDAKWDALVAKYDTARPPTRREVGYLRRAFLITGLRNLLQASPTRSWVGSATDLAELLDHPVKPPRWPSSPSGLALLLRESYSELRRNGVDFDPHWAKDSKSRRPLYKLELTEGISKREAGE